MAESRIKGEPMNPWTDFDEHCWNLYWILDFQAWQQDQKIKEMKKNGA